MNNNSNQSNRTIRIGSRESQLARLQTDFVIAQLQAKFPDLIFEVVLITTGGDKVLDRPLAEIGGRGVFVKELEEALLEERVDLVVHSLKDLPTDLPLGLTLASVLLREDPRDVFVSEKATSLATLAPGSTVATSSRRRAAQIQALRKDLKFVDMRGNIPTRMRKLKEGQCDAMILAAAGLLRLGLKNDIPEFLEPTQCTPAVGQGALAIECSLNNHFILELCKAIECPDTRDQIDAERAFLGELGSGCSIPVGALATTTRDKLTLLGCIAALDGSEIYRDSIEGPRTKAYTLGRELAHKLAHSGATKVLEDLRLSLPNVVSPP